MIATEIRDANWREIEGRMTGLRAKAYGHLLAFRDTGQTTRELARNMGVSELSARPRVTELCQLGLAECVGRRGREGLYRGIPMAVARAAFEARRAGQAEQRLLPLMV